MDTLSISPYALAALFLVVAFVYSAVGLGGGSSYIALMVIFGMGTLAIPLISLSLNVAVTTVGSLNFIRKRHARFRLILPFLISSIPMAYVGGALDMPKAAFRWILLLSLVFVVLRIYVWQKTSFNLDIGERGRIALSLVSGALLGLVAGIVGIGGGIYLVPLIILLKLGTEKEAAACGAVFIWLNSCSGLVSRLQYNTIDIVSCLPFIAAVLIGGTAGSYMGSSRFSPKTMERILGMVIVLAILFLAREIFFSRPTP